jgi:hypothetical protein
LIGAPLALTLERARGCPNPRANPRKPHEQRRRQACVAPARATGGRMIDAL